jgi:peptidylprolyl isomerase
MKRRKLRTAILLTLLPVLASSSRVRAAEPPATPAPDAQTTAPATPAAPATSAAAPAARPAIAAIPAPPDVAAPPADAQTTASGLASKVLKAGTGTVHPGPNDRVKVDYTGWTTDGKMFDSSIARGKPAILPLDKVIAGWGEGLQLMVKGETRRLWIPAKLAYEGLPNKPQGMLVFDVTLIDLQTAPPPAPPDVAAPPADAQHTKSGLAYKVLTPAAGKHPKGDSIVKVNYTGWTTDGKMFDSSIARGTPANFNLGKVIPGWTEGIQLMAPGETARFWIPEKLAYKGAEGVPAGTLVFDIELIEIVKQ